MAHHIDTWLSKASFTTDDLSGGTNGGQLSPQQARTFLRDAIEATALLAQADVFDSASPVFEIPKIAFGNRIMRAGVEGARLDSSDREKPSTGLVSLETKLFKGEVPVSDELFEDNVEGAGVADTIMAMIAEAVGRDLEEAAIKSSDDDSDPFFSALGDGIVQQLLNANVDQAVGSESSYRAAFAKMVEALPSRYRRDWNQYVVAVSPTVADAYAAELGERATGLGDSNLDTKTQLRYRGIPVVEVPLMAGTQDSVDYGDFAVLCNPKNLAVGFHRRVRVERYRDPREGVTSFLPSVRMDVKWKQPEAAVLGTGISGI